MGGQSGRPKWEAKVGGQFGRPCEAKVGGRCGRPKCEEASGRWEAVRGCERPNLEAM